MTTFHRQPEVPLHKFIEGCAKVVDDSDPTDDDVRFNISYEDWEELKKLAPVAPEEEQGAELSVFIGEKRFIVAPLLGLARDVLMVARGGEN